MFRTGAGRLEQGEQELPQIGIVIIFWSPGGGLGVWHHPVLGPGRVRFLVTQGPMDKVLVAGAEQEGAGSSGTHNCNAHQSEGRVEIFKYHLQMQVICGLFAS